MPYSICNKMFLSLSCRSFFELMLFFSKEEFVEKPLKDILDSFQVTKTDPVSILSYSNNTLS